MVLHILTFLPSPPSDPLSLFLPSTVFEFFFSHNLEQLNLQLTQNEKRVSKCKHEGKTCQQNVTRGFLKTWVIAYLVKYAIGILPALLAGKVFKK